MKKLLFFIAIVLFVSGISCGTEGSQDNETKFLIKTGFGEITIRLFDETPQHKNNFIKLVNEGFYNDLLFHRVI